MFDKIGSSMFDKMGNAMATEVNDLPSFAAEVARRARDAAYVAVGLGVLGIQRAQTARHDLLRQDRLDESAARVRAGVATGTRQVGRQVGEWLDGTLSLVSSQLSPLADELPEPARELAGKARAALEEVGAQLRHLATPGA